MDNQTNENEIFNEDKKERALLISVDTGDFNAEVSMEELEELAKTAGAEVVGTSIQKRQTPVAATYIGKGALYEMTRFCENMNIDLIIADSELSPVQIRNLEDETNTRVIDRTTLILDIFAARATSREGKLQVELAQMRYRLPRLIGQGQVLSRLGGGIGTRGPGEKKLEIDRRRIRRRVFELETELSEIEKQRGLRRESRKANRIPLVALVGYTNAGKSTMLNALTDSNVLAEDKLFATLDPVVRKITLSGGTEALLSDTVGFINKLPHDLVEAFKSTLEEVSNSDLILQVVDISCPYHEKQMRVVDGVLESLHAADIPRIIVFNKADAIPSCDLPAESENRLNVSALCGTGIEKLLSAVELKLNSARTEVDILVPYSKYEAVSMIRDRGMLLSEEHTETGTHIRALLDAESIGQLRKILDF